MGLFSKLQNSIEAEDPYYIRIEENVNGATVTKKIKKQFPQGLSKNDEKILKSVKRRAYYMDFVFGLCGFNIGFAAIIGLIPFIGVAINVWIGYQLIEKAKGVDGGLSKWHESRMYANLAADAALGFCPIVGDFVSAYYKSNARNSALLEHHLQEVAQKKHGQKLPASNVPTAPISGTPAVHEPAIEPSVEPKVGHESAAQQPTPAEVK